MQLLVNRAALGQQVSFRSRCSFRSTRHLAVVLVIQCTTMCYQDTRIVVNDFMGLSSQEFHAIIQSGILLDNPVKAQVVNK